MYIPYRVRSLDFLEYVTFETIGVSFSLSYHPFLIFIRHKCCSHIAFGIFPKFYALYASCIEVTSSGGIFRGVTKVFKLFCHQDIEKSVQNSICSVLEKLTKLQARQLQIF